MSNLPTQKRPKPLRSTRNSASKPPMPKKQAVKGVTLHKDIKTTADTPPMPSQKAKTAPKKIAKFPTAKERMEKTPDLFERRQLGIDRRKDPRGDGRKKGEDRRKTPLTPLQTLIALENEALNANDRLALKHQAVNNPRRLLDVGHIFWLNRQGKRIKVAAMSSQSEVNQSSPLIQDLCHIFREKLGKEALKPFEFNLSSGPKNKRPFEYPFPYAYFAPFTSHSETGGLLFTRRDPFKDPQKVIMTRLAQSYGTVWSAQSKKKRATMTGRKKYFLGGGALLLALCGLIPVPVTTLAPAEIVADNPYIIAAPMDGVIEKILIEPNSPVEAGTVLARMVDTDVKNQAQVASEEERVAKARLKRASLTSFIDEAAKRELAVAKAETKLAKARTAYAMEKFNQTTLSTPHTGLAIYSNPQDWEGRPVATGEAIIEIADPSKILLEIDAPLLAGEDLEPGTRVRVFMDSDPLTPLEATLERASYYASPTDNGQMAYRTYARISSETAQPRIGARGVAKIYGDTAPLALFLFRRPIAAVRQFIGH